MPKVIARIAVSVILITPSKSSALTGNTTLSWVKMISMIVLF
jgi:hypothetical protein